MSVGLCFGAQLASRMHYDAEPTGEWPLLWRLPTWGRGNNTIRLGGYRPFRRPHMHVMYVIFLVIWGHP